MEMIRNRFGTYRGLARAALGFGQAAFVRAPDLAGTERLVFVCHGNICRSAFAEGFTQAQGWPTASFGLSTSPDRPAHPPIKLAARDYEIDLNRHLSTPLELFEPRVGDLYLVMEIRQIARLRRDPRFKDSKIDLLGRYGGMPHLHDPYRLSDAFARTSLRDIVRSVRGLIAAIKNVRVSAPR